MPFNESSKLRRSFWIRCIDGSFSITSPPNSFAGNLLVSVITSSAESALAPVPNAQSSTDQPAVPPTDCFCPISDDRIQQRPNAFLPLLFNKSNGVRSSAKSHSHFSFSPSKETRNRHESKFLFDENVSKTTSITTAKIRKKEREKVKSPIQIGDERENEQIFIIMNTIIDMCGRRRAVKKTKQRQKDN